MGTAGLSCQGLLQRPWDWQGLWHQSSLLHGQELESDEEWQHLIEDTEPSAMQQNVLLGLLRDPAFQHRVQGRLADSAQQVTDGWPRQLRLETWMLPSSSGLGWKHTESLQSSQQKDPLLLQKLELSCALGLLSAPLLSPA